MPKEIQSIISSENLTMSSMEIADLVEKRHDNVKRVVGLCLKNEAIGQPQIEDDPFVDKQGKERSRQVYRLGKRDTLVVVAQLSPKFTGRIIDRWQELERQAALGSKSWREVRNKGKEVRTDFTDTLRHHGCTKPHHYMNCSKAVSKAATGKTPKQIREERRVDNARDGMTRMELATTLLIEELASENMDRLEVVGFKPCYAVTKISATSVKAALENNKNALLQSDELNIRQSPKATVEAA